LQAHEVGVRDAGKSDCHGDQGCAEGNDVDKALDGGGDDGPTIAPFATPTRADYWLFVPRPIRALPRKTHCWSLARLPEGDLPVPQVTSLRNFDRVSPNNNWCDALAAKDASTAGDGGARAIDQR